VSARPAGSDLSGVKASDSLSTLSGSTVTHAPAATQAEVGPAVAREAWNVTLACYKNFLVGQGHLRVLSGPPSAVN